MEASAEARCGELGSGRFEGVLAAQRSAGDYHKAKECVGHMDRNRDRVRYAEFRAAGLCIGSGLVECAFKSIVAMRLRRFETNWIVAGPPPFSRHAAALNRIAMGTSGLIDQPKSEQVSAS